MIILFFLIFLIEFNQADKNLKTRININSITIENLIELNKKLKTETFFNSIKFKKPLLATIKFNFSSNFKNLSHFYHLERAQISIKHLNEFNLHSSKYYFVKYLNLFLNASNESISLNENLEQSLCRSEENFIKYCYYKNSNLTSQEYMLETLSISLNHTGLFVICINLFTMLNPNLLIFTENMCQNLRAEYLQRESENHSFRYKPLFILLMYILCASILVPISIFQHFRTASKSKLKIKIDAPSNCDVTDTSTSGLMRNSTASLKKDYLNKDLLSPLIESHSESGHVEFHLKEMDESMQSELNEEKSNEADHILDSKPWMQTTESVPDNNSILLHKTNSFESKDFKRINQYEFLTNKVLFESNV